MSDVIFRVLILPATASLLFVHGHCHVVIHCDFSLSLSLSFPGHIGILPLFALPLPPKKGGNTCVQTYKHAMAWVLTILAMSSFADFKAGREEQGCAPLSMTLPSLLLPACGCSRYRAVEGTCSPLVVL